MKTLFIADSCGQGHRVRCGALAAELERRGGETFTIGPHDPIPRRLFHAVVIDMRAYVPPVPGIERTIRIIDDVSQQGPADLIVLGCASQCGELLLSAGEGHVLLGPRYSLLRREFASERRAEHLLRDGTFDARRISGWSAEALAEQFGEARVVISYAGMRAMEAACVGTPAVLVVRNRGEKLNATGLVEAGAAVLSTGDEAENVAEALHELPETQKRMGIAGTQLVDGLGCQRVADEIEELFR